MAWRIEDAVIRGEIDNRTRGRVTGFVWLVGRARPVVLDLKGNCCRDLAGRRLRFEHRHPRAGASDGLGEYQRGVVGEITGSRKVQVLDVPVQPAARCDRGMESLPTPVENSLHLEWFSAANARVIIAGAGFGLTMVGEPRWDMTPGEEAARHEANTQAIAGFVRGLGQTFAGSLATPDPIHPLAARLAQLTKQAGGVAGAPGLIEAARVAGSLLAGALVGDSWPPPRERCSEALAQLTRARDLLEHALYARESGYGVRLHPSLAAMFVELAQVLRDLDESVAAIRAILVRGAG